MPNVANEVALTSFASSFFLCVFLFFFLFETSFLSLVSSATLYQPLVIISF